MLFIPSNLIHIKFSGEVIRESRRNYNSVRIFTFSLWSLDIEMISVNWCILHIKLFNDQYKLITYLIILRKIFSISILNCKISYTLKISSFWIIKHRQIISFTQFGQIMIIVLKTHTRLSFYILLTNRIKLL